MKRTTINDHILQMRRAGATDTEVQRWLESLSAEVRDPAPSDQACATAPDEQSEEADAWPKSEDSRS